MFWKIERKEKTRERSTLEMNVVLHDGFSKNLPFFTDDSCADLSRFGLCPQALTELSAEPRRADVEWLPE